MSIKIRNDRFGLVSKYGYINYSLEINERTRQQYFSITKWMAKNIGDHDINTPYHERLWVTGSAYDGGFDIYFKNTDVLIEFILKW
jgi:hypothetical protein